jgi:hypothetical protein
LTKPREQYLALSYSEEGHISVLFRERQKSRQLLSVLREIERITNAPTIKFKYLKSVSVVVELSTNCYHSADAAIKRGLDPGGLASEESTMASCCLGVGDGGNLCCVDHLSGERSLHDSGRKYDD